MRSPSRPGMTFVEVLSAAGILIVCCLVLLALLPPAMQAQRMARYRIYAAAAAMTMMESFAHTPAVPTGISDHLYPYRVTNLAATGAPPNPGWASLLRSKTGLGSSFAPDLERVVSRIGGGAIPLPNEIARRLDSDGDEIRRVLDAGGSLFYLDPAAARGMSGLAGATDASALAGIPEEFHHLVFAVVSPAQQNVLPAHPFQMTKPPSAMYPFPPLWQWWIPERSNAVNRGSSVSVRWEPPPADTPANTPLTPIRGRHSRELSALNKDEDEIRCGIQWEVSTTTVLGDPLDETQPIGEWHGCIWKYLADKNRTLNPGSPWVRGWWAFKRLAGDEFAGWMPVLWALDVAGSPATYEQLVNYRDRALFLWWKVMPTNMQAAFPAPYEYTDTSPIKVQNGTQSTANGYTSTNVGRHDLSTGVTDAWSWTSDNVSGVSGVSGFSGSPHCLKEYRWVRPTDYDNDGAKTKLDQVQFLDPYDPAVGQFPPHPAQVYALSYLAHAAMLVAGASETTGFDGFKATATGVPDARVTEKDRVFARKMHEMSLRWAVAYANECPADWAAPRPVNRPVMTDRPLQMWDLWFDNGSRAAASGGGLNSAQRVPQNLGGNITNANGWDRVTPESFYRWIEAPNPNLPRQPNGELQFVRSGVGPIGFGVGAANYADNPLSTASFRSGSLWQYDYKSSTPPLRPPTSVEAGSPALDHWKRWCNGGGVNASPWPAWLNEPAPQHDVNHWWIGRAFAPRDRARELVFWAVNWKAYEDSEEVPGSPVDFGKTGRIPGLVGCYEQAPTVASPGTLATPNPDAVWVSHWAARLPTPANRTHADNTSSTTRIGSSALYGTPEAMYAWIDATRTTSFIRSITESDSGNYNAVSALGTNAPGTTPNPAIAHARIHLVAFGADRNMNGVLDRGPVPRTQRMRVQEVSRFVFYDPILYLDQGGK